ncbi:MAG: RING finger domain-containing protein, partial [Candidatus Helarchaeota archaeon]
ISATEFYIKNNCRDCVHFRYRSHSCSKLNEIQIYQFIEKAQFCPYFEKIEKSADDIRSIQSLLKEKDEIKLKELASKFETTISEIESWLKELVEDGIIKGEISGSKFIPLKEVNYEELDAYQFDTENQCAICHEPLETQETTSCRNCNANFHKVCILKYIEEHKRCPVCTSLFRWI